MSPQTKIKLPPRWAAYMRTSDLEASAAKLSEPEQRDKIKQLFCKPNGIEIPPERWFYDHDVTGAKMRRPSFDQMMALAEAHQIDGVIVARINRFGRTIVGALAEADKLNKLGVLVMSATEPVNNVDSMGKFLLAQFLAMAELDLDRIRENWDWVHSNAIENGRYTGRSPHFAYRKDHGKLYIIPDQAQVVRDLFHKRAQRISWMGLADWMNTAWPRKDGKPWTDRSVRGIITNRIYVGEVRFGKYVNPDAHEPIVTLAEFDAANGIASTHTAGTGNDLPFLAGTIRCAGCRYGMRRVWSPRKDGKLEGYTCSRNRNRPCPDPAYITAEDVETLVTSLFAMWHLHAEHEPPRPELADLEEAESKLADLDRRFEEIADNDARRDAMGDDRYYADLARRRKQIEQQQATVRKLKADAAQEEHRPIMLEDQWRHLDIEEQRTILRRAIDSVYVKRGKTTHGDKILGLDPEVMKRVIVKWSGEDRFDRPERGRSDYVTQSVPWPDLSGDLMGDFTTMYNVNTPEWTRKAEAVGGLIVPDVVVKAFED